MAHHKDRAIVFIEGRFQRFYGFNIAVIAWFVQNKKLFGVAMPKRTGQPCPQSLPPAERPDLSQRIVPAEQKSALDLWQLLPVLRGSRPMLDLRFLTIGSETFNVARSTAGFKSRR